MNKKLLAISVAAAMSAGTASAMEVQENGIGLYNILPYYSVQDGNATLIHVTNTDTVNGKAVKVRFRGAEWSDDVFDFQVFLSPGDIWTGAVSRNGDLASMNTTDNSCTLPASVNQDFVTFRLDASADRAAGTREGYIEIITMADIPPETFVQDDPDTHLYTAIKHVDGVAPCTSSVLTGLLRDTGSVDGNQGMDVPSAGSLASFATIINVPSSKAFTVAGTALNPDDETLQRKLYFRQANELLAATEADVLTADRIFAGADTEGGRAGADLAMYQFDMPDLSTPFASAGTTPIDQRDSIARALERAQVIVEYVSDDAILATTDVVLNQPIRRFFYEYQLETVAGTGYFINDQWMTIHGADDTVYASLSGATNRINVGNPTFFDREEGTVVSVTDIVISPTLPGTDQVFALRGEASVISINNGTLPTGSLGASLTANNYETSLASPDGWVTLSTTVTGDIGDALSASLPVIGFNAINVFNGAVGAAGTNYGITLPLRTPAVPTP